MLAFRQAGSFATGRNRGINDLGMTQGIHYVSLIGSITNGTSVCGITARRTSGSGGYTLIIMVHGKVGIHVEDNLLGGIQTIVRTHDIAFFKAY